MARIACIALLTIASVASAGKLTEGYEGRWEAFSANSANMRVTKDTLIYNKKEQFRFNVIARFDDSIILEFEEPVGCGRYMRLGPRRQDATFKNMWEVSIYHEKEKALANIRSSAPWASKYEGHCSWSAYTR